VVGRKVLLVLRVTKVVGRERMDEESVSESEWTVLVVLALLVICRGLWGSWGGMCEWRSWLSQLESRAAAAAGLTFPVFAVVNCRAPHLNDDFSFSWWLPGGVSGFAIMRPNKEDADPQSWLVPLLRLRRKKKTEAIVRMRNARGHEYQLLLLCAAGASGFIPRVPTTIPAICPGLGALLSLNAWIGSALDVVVATVKS
jgi:hypothetical protein